MLIDLLAQGAQERLTFTVLLSDVGDSGRVQMPVAITERWVHPANQRKIVITASYLRTAIQNFRKKGNGEINVDYDHASDIPNFVGGARPSAGRVLALRGPEPYTDSRGTRREILWGSYEPTERARGMIRKREYRYISPVLGRERIDKITGETQGMTITTIALTNTPVLEEMPEMFCSEEGQVLRSADIEFSPRVGRGRFEASQNAREKLARLAKERARRDSITYEKALRIVAAENRELYVQASETSTIEAGTQHGNFTASDELARRATAKAKEEGTDYQTALSEICVEDRTLVRRWQREITCED